MPKPGAAQSTRFDDQEDPTPEVQDGTTDDQNSTIDEDGFEQAEESGLDEGTENQDDAEGDEGDGGEFEEADEVIVDPRDEKISNLENQLKELVEKVNKPQNPIPAQPVERTYSEDEKMAISARFGGAPFEQIKAFSDMVTNFHQGTISEIKKYVEAALGDIRKGTAIESFAKSPGFTDAVKYRQGMESYLAKLPPEKRAVQENLEMAYHYARSTAMNKTMKTVRANKDRNKRIVMNGRPTGGDRPNGKSVSLSNDEIRAAKSAGMSLVEYAKYKKPLHLIR